MRVIITGAASGIGRATAILLAEIPPNKAAPHIFLVDRDRANLESAAHDLEAKGARAHICVADLADAAEPDRVVGDAQRALGGLDALVSNAGASHAMMLKDLDRVAYDHLFAINTRATALLAKAAYPMLKDARGSLVATASIASSHPTPHFGVYSATKAALAMLVQQMALEWGPDGIRCNCVSPGPTVTGMTAHVYGQAEGYQKRAAQIPLRRIGTPEDLAGAIVFLLGPHASFITGINLIVDGGVSTSLMGSPIPALSAQMASPKL